MQYFTICKDVVLLIGEWLDDKHFMRWCEVNHTALKSKDKKDETWSDVQWSDDVQLVIIERMTFLSGIEKKVRDYVKIAHRITKDTFEDHIPLEIMYTPYSVPLYMTLVSTDRGVTFDCSFTKKTDHFYISGTLYKGVIRGMVWRSAADHVYFIGPGTVTERANLSYSNGTTIHNKFDILYKRGFRNVLGEEKWLTYY